MNIQQLKPFDGMTAQDRTLATAYWQVKNILEGKPPVFGLNEWISSFRLQIQQLKAGIDGLPRFNGRGFDNNDRYQNFCLASQLHEKALLAYFEHEHKIVATNRVPETKESSGFNRLKVRKYYVLYSLGFGPYLPKEDALGLGWLKASNRSEYVESTISAWRAQNPPAMNLVEAQRAVMSWMESAASANAKIVDAEGNIATDTKVLPVHRRLGIAEAKKYLRGHGDERYLIAILALIAQKDRLSEGIAFTMPSCATSEEYQIIEHETRRRCRCGDNRALGNPKDAESTSGCCAQG